MGGVGERSGADASRAKHPRRLALWAAGSTADHRPLGRLTRRGVHDCELGKRQSAAARRTSHTSSRTEADYICWSSQAAPNSGAFAIDSKARRILAGLFWNLRERLEFTSIAYWRVPMTKIKLAFITASALAGVGLNTGTASAMPFGSAPNNGEFLQNVRLVCDQPLAQPRRV
jgi:hypothetical protein